MLRDPAKLLLSGGVERIGEGLRFTDMGAVRLQRHGPDQDGAVRMRTTYGGLPVGLLARQNGAGDRYILRAAKGGSEILLEHWDETASRTTPLHKFPVRVPLQDGQNYELELRIVGQTLTANLNAEVLGTFADKTLVEGKFGVVCIDGKGVPTVIKSLEVLDLDLPSGASATPTGARLSPSTEPWHEFMKSPDDFTLHLGASRTDAGLTLPSQSNASVKDRHSDGAIRAVGAFDPSNGITLRARQSKDYKSRYELMLGPNQLSLVKVIDSTRTTLFEKPMRRSLAAGDRYDIELRLVGPTITVRSDSVLVGEARDETLTEGGFNVTNSGNGTAPLENFLYLPLDGIPKAGVLKLDAPAQADPRAFAR